MPDWTYIPLRKTALGIFGNEARSRKFALGLITNVAKLPGGPTIIRGFDYTHDHDAAQVQVGDTLLASPIGVAVPHASPARQQAFASMGYGFAVEPDALPAQATVSEATTIEGLVEELDQGATLLVANAAVVELGPTVAQRVNETLAQRENERAGHEVEVINWFRPLS